MSLTGEPDSPPTKSGLSLVDLRRGMSPRSRCRRCVARPADGTGCDCDVSLFETALAGSATSARGRRPRVGAARARPTPRICRSSRSRPSATADGWLVVACAKEKFWLSLCEALGRRELADDPRFAGFEERDRNRVELLELLDAAFAARATGEWLDVLDGRAACPAHRGTTSRAPSRTPRSPHGTPVLEYEHPSLGRVRQAASRCASTTRRRVPSARRSAVSTRRACYGTSAATAVTASRSSAPPACSAP